MEARPTYSVELMAKGVDEFTSFLEASKERLRVGAARHNFETATLTRDLALQNMSGMGIGLVTGRSRALYGVKAGGGMFGASGSPAAYAGYLSWPSDVVFYPLFLNDGTVRMVARPYHDAAVEKARRFFYAEAPRVLEYALTGRWEP